jgi:hypothetical protein
MDRKLIYVLTYKIHIMNSNIEYQANYILYNCVLRGLEAIEDSPADALFNAMLIKFGLSYKQLFTNYNLFEKALHDLLGRDNADVIINITRKEILRISHTQQNEPAVNKLREVLK